jgi:hypothetical protein
MNEIRTLLDDLAGDPPADLDLDRLIDRGRRRAKLRGLGASALAAALVAGTIGAAVAFGAGSERSAEPAGSPTAAQSTRAVRTITGEPALGESYRPRPTVKSKELATQLRTLVPEYGTARYSRDDGQYFDDQARPTRWLTAGVSVTDPRAAHHQLPVFDLTIAAPGAAGRSPIDVICTSMIPEDGPCVGTPRRLSDGSQARVHSRLVDGERRYAVLIIKPDGTRIVVDGGIMWADGVKNLPDLGPDRLIEIGQAVTVRP